MRNKTWRTIIIVSFAETLFRKTNKFVKNLSAKNQLTDQRRLGAVVIALLFSTMFIGLFQLPKMAVAAPVWSDGFESGDSSGWNSTPEPSVTIVTTPKRTGSYAMRVDDSHCYEHEDLSSSLASFNVTFFYNFSVLPDAGSGRYEILDVRTGAGQLFTLDALEAGWLFYGWDGTQLTTLLTNTTTAPSTDIWNEITFLAGIGSAGNYTVYINDVCYYQNLTINNAGRGNVTYFYLGQPYTAGTFNYQYFDDVSYGVIEEEAPPLTAQSGYNYTLATNATSNYVIAENNTVVASNSNPVTAFASAVTYANNSGATALYIKSGTYTGAASFTMTSNVNMTITFDADSLFTLSNWVNDTVVYMNQCVNCSLIQPTIDGNSAYQKASTPVTTSHGVQMDDCSGCLVTGANITDCRQFGFLNGENTPQALPNGVTNSTFTFCGWNGISLGWGDQSTQTQGHYAKNNTIAYSSDVGISTWGANKTIIQNNYIHNLNGSSGGAGDSSWGVAIEYNGYGNIVENNTIINCSKGINVGEDCASNLIKNNNVTNCKAGIFSGGGGYDVITNNTVQNCWGLSSYQASIYVGSCSGDIVSFNTLTNTNTTTGLGDAIFLTNARNASVCNNTITYSLSATYAYGVNFDNSSYCIFEYNTVRANIGVKVGSAPADPALSVENKIDKNNLTACNTPIDDDGTGTIYNPTSNTNYAIFVSNIYNRNSNGKFIYSNVTDITITLASGGVLNLNGENVTLTSYTYTLNMTRDNFAIVYGSTASITTITSATISVSLIDPVDAYTLTSTWTTNFVYYPLVKDDNINDSSFWLNGTQIASNTTAVSNATLNTYQYTFSTNGTYIWTVRVSNSTTSVFALVNRTLIVAVYVADVVTPSEPANFYFISETHTVNNVTGYAISLTSGWTNSSAGGQAVPETAITQYGFRAWVIHYNGSEECLTGDYVVGVITRESTGQGMQNATYSGIPYTSLVIGLNAIKVSIYIRFDYGEWFVINNFVSDFLVKKAIMEGTWTLNLYTKVVQSGGSTYGYLYWGNQMCLSGLGGVEFDEPLPQEVALSYGSSGDFFGMIAYPYLYWAGSIFYGIALLFVGGTLYVRHRRFEVILIIFLLFGGTSGFGLLIPNVAYRLIYIIILFVIAAMLYRLMR